MSKPELPVTLQVGDTVCEIGAVELPLTTPKTVGRRTVEVSLDLPELKQRLAELLRKAADVLEQGDSDGD